VGVFVRDGLVVEPDSAFGQVAEVQRAAGWDGHRGAAGAVRPAAQWMRERIPAVEVTYHGYGPSRGFAGQREGDPHGAVAPWLRSLDQLSSPLLLRVMPAETIYPELVFNITHAAIPALRHGADERTRQRVGKDG